MDHHHFAAISNILCHAPSRRHVLHGLAALGTAIGASTMPDAGEAKRKKKKGEKKKKQKGKKREQPPPPPPAASPPPPPPPCAATCAGKPCDADDGCGGMCGCAAGSVCHEGICQACTVTCDGYGQTCGAALKTALAGGGTIYACPGRYVGNFEIGPGNVDLIGAGSGAEAATSTILDANGNGRVMHVKQGATAALRRLRVTGGTLTQMAEQGGGISNQGRLTLSQCAVHKNTAPNAGGIFQQSASELTINNCAITDNTAPVQYGGGIWALSGPVTINGGSFTGNRALLGGAIATRNTSVVTIRGCTITGNRAETGAGLVNEGTVNFDSASRISANIAKASGGGIYQADGATTTLNGARVVSNHPTNCDPAGSIAGCSG